ncbi:hypothetical protein OF83DRAFT_76469 [Amylostereum chailletii]|nr:hypothetical protein OF83DRAFT_76469 [Amylostereum chailletii]
MGMIAWGALRRNSICPTLLTAYLCLIPHPSGTPFPGGCEMSTLDTIILFDPAQNKMPSAQWCCTGTYNSWTIWKSPPKLTGPFRQNCVAEQRSSLSFQPPRCEQYGKLAEPYSSLGRR